MKKIDYNRNPNGSNQHEPRSNVELQKIINLHPLWTKKDFRGEGRKNPDKGNALLTRKETERPGLVFGNYGGTKQYKNDKLRCSMCKIFKDLEDFPNDKYGSSNGKRSNCSSCDIKRNQEYRSSINNI